MTQQYDAHPAQVKLAKVFSSVRLIGPPMSDKLVKLVAHLFSPEESEVAVHLPYFTPKSLEKVAKKARRVPELIKPLLDTMANRRVIYGGDPGYSLMPIIPGIFEYILMDGSDSEFHRKFAELLVDIYGTGYMRRYSKQRTPAIRNIPVQSVIESKNHVVDSDLMSEMIDCHTDMAVAKVCQCRQSMNFVDKECKRSTPQDGCLIFGSFALAALDNDLANRVDQARMRDIVHERWEKKLVFLTANVSPQSPNAICTCCDCCCHALESINHYDGEVIMAAPHFLAKVDNSLCNNCGKCSKACNTLAHTRMNKKHFYNSEKCIGCGVCVGVCKEEAISMVENPNYKQPSKSLVTLGLKLLPATTMGSIRAKFARD